MKIDEIENLDSKCSGIYILKNKINKLIYIGSSIQIKYRVRSHKKALKRGNHQNRKLQNFYNKYGEDSIYFELLEIVTDKNKLIEREQYWFDKLKPFNENGFNIATVAGSNLGCKMSEENRRKLSERQKGKYNFSNYVITDRHRQIISNFMKGNKNSLGRKMSDEQRKSISDRMISHKYNVGRKQSEEHKRKLSELNKGHKRNKKKPF